MSTRSLKGLRIPGIIRLGLITHTIASFSVKKIIFIFNVFFVRLLKHNLAKVNCMKKARESYIIFSLHFFYVIQEINNETII